MYDVYSFLIFELEFFKSDDDDFVGFDEVVSQVLLIMKRDIFVVDILIQEKLVCMLNFNFIGIEVGKVRLVNDEFN